MRSCLLFSSPLRLAFSSAPSLSSLLRMCARVRERRRFLSFLPLFLYSSLTSSSLSPLSPPTSFLSTFMSRGQKFTPLHFYVSLPSFFSIPLSFPLLPSSVLPSHEESHVCPLTSLLFSHAMENISIVHEIFVSPSHHCSCARVFL